MVGDTAMPGIVLTAHGEASTGLTARSLFLRSTLMAVFTTLTIHTDRFTEEAFTTHTLIHTILTVQLLSVTAAVTTTLTVLLMPITLLAGVQPEVEVGCMVQEEAMVPVTPVATEEAVLLTPANLTRVRPAILITQRPMVHGVNLMVLPLRLRMVQHVPAPVDGVT